MREYDETRLKNLLNKYKEKLDRACFSTPEQEWIQSLTEHEDLLDIVEMLMDFNIELNYIYEYCPDSIYVTDANGITQRVNKAFEEVTGTRRQEVMGRFVMDLEKEGYFQPAVYGIMIRERRKVSILQSSHKGTNIVTSIPICDEDRNIYKIVSNSRSLDEIKEISYYVEQSTAKVREKESTIIAESEAMKDVLKIAWQVADVDSNILITGESGVGKGVLAHFMHENSHRRDKAFIEINSGAIPETLIESELFGYESGAFTGAGKKGKPGLIELADKGTLFLDEIGELPMLLQVKLLSFLQNGKIMRVGGTKEIDVDARVIAATNKDLVKMVADGKFREDLFYRLNVIPILIPPLRERPEDIYPAAHYFANKYKKKYHKEFELNDTFLENLLNYDWMGNIRELENYIERMVVMSEGSNNAMLKLTKQAADDSTMNHLTLVEKLEKYEAEIVKSAYKKNPTTYGLAQALGISQPSASRKIKKYVDGLKK